MPKSYQWVGIGVIQEIKILRRVPSHVSLKQLNFLIVDVTVDSITCGDRHTCLDLWALKKLRFMQNGQLIITVKLARITVKEFDGR